MDQMERKVFNILSKYKSDFSSKEFVPNFPSSDILMNFFIMTQKCKICNIGIESLEEFGN